VVGRRGGASTRRSRCFSACSGARRRSARSTGWYGSHSGLPKPIRHPTRRSPATSSTGSAGRAPPRDPVRARAALGALPAGAGRSRPVAAAHGQWRPRTGTRPATDLRVEQ
jgi:hypothetical protein